MIVGMRSIWHRSHQTIAVIWDRAISIVGYGEEPMVGLSLVILESEFCDFRSRRDRLQFPSRAASQMQVKPTRRLEYGGADKFDAITSFVTAVINSKRSKKVEDG